MLPQYSCNVCAVWNSFAHWGSWHFESVLFIRVFSPLPPSSPFCIPTRLPLNEYTFIYFISSQLISLCAQLKGTDLRILVVRHKRMYEQNTCEAMERKECCSQSIEAEISRFPKRLFDDAGKFSRSLRFGKLIANVIIPLSLPPIPARPRPHLPSLFLSWMRFHLS